MSMLKLFIALLFLMSPFMLRAAEYDSAFTSMIYNEQGIKPDECIRSVGLGMVIVTKIDEHIYQTVSNIGGNVVARGLLKTVKSNFRGEGDVNIMVRYRGVKVMKLENGFDANFGLWEECK